VREQEDCSVRDNERDEKGKDLMKSRLEEGDGREGWRTVVSDGEREKERTSEVEEAR